MYMLTSCLYLSAANINICTQHLTLTDNTHQPSLGPLLFGHLAAASQLHIHWPHPLTLTHWPHPSSLTHWPHPGPLAAASQLYTHWPHPSTPHSLATPIDPHSLVTPRTLSGSITTSHSLATPINSHSLATPWTLSGSITNFTLTGHTHQPLTH